MGWKDDAKTIWDGFSTDPRHPNAEIPHEHEGHNGVWCRECGKPLWDEIHDPKNYKTKDAEVSPEQAEKNLKNREYVRKSRANSDFGYPRSQS
jgi:hypothetical protein